MKQRFWTAPVNYSLDKRGTLQGVETVIRHPLECSAHYRDLEGGAFSIVDDVVEDIALRDLGDLTFIKDRKHSN